MRFLRFLSLTLAGALWPCLALAHASDRGHVLLLSTGYYIAGGAFAVGASFLVLALLPSGFLERAWQWRLPLFTFGDRAKTVVGLLSFAGFALLLAAGSWGSRDPLSNPLPLTVWTLLWAGFVLLQGMVGDLWSWLNPWQGPYRLVMRLGFVRNEPSKGGAGCWPAFALFLAFAWFELVDPAPDDPARLAVAAGLYWLVGFIAMLAFGYENWARRGEFLSVFFSMLARFSMVGRGADGRFYLNLPGARLLDTPSLPLSGVAFLLLALSSVSFDGLGKTFLWLGSIGVNPLEYPGRTALIGSATLGLVLTFLLLALLFAVAVFFGLRLAGRAHGFANAAGLLVWSIVPIALAYHVAHYLTALLVDGQYALVTLSDPFARGWDIFGTANMQVEAGIVAGATAAWWIWNIQAATIVCGHVLAVLVAHVFAARLDPSPVRAVLTQIPLTILMIAYTVFGLWLLATPAVG